MSAFGSCFIYHAAAGYLGEMQPMPANFTNHFVAHNDIASAFNETGAGLRGGPKNPIDSMRFGEPFPEYQGGFTEPKLYSSVATMGNSLDESLQTFMSEALYTNNLTQNELDELRAAGITQVIFHFRLQLFSCNVLVPILLLGSLSTTTLLSATVMSSTQVYLQGFRFLKALWHRTSALVWEVFVNVIFKSF